MGKYRKVEVATVLYAGVAIFFGSLIVIGILIYGFDMRNQFTQKGYRIFPYPAAVIGGVNFIALRSLDVNLAAIRKFYEEQNFSSVGLSVDFNSEDGKKRLAIKEKDALTKMIEDRIIEILANKRGIVLTQATVTKEVQKRAAEFGDQQALAENVQKLYGWNIAEFEAKIVKPEMYKEFLAVELQKIEPANIQAKTRIEEAAEELAKSNDFAMTAKKYSEGESAKNGGDLGWLSADQMLPEIAIAIYSMKKGETSEIIRSSLGFHIIRVEDKKTDNGVNKLQLRQIFVRTLAFADWLLEQEKNISIHIPLKGLYWNTENGQVEFSNAELRQFEDDLENNSAKDASILF